MKGSCVARAGGNTRGAANAKGFVCLAWAVFGNSMGGADCNTRKAAVTDRACGGAKGDGRGLCVGQFSQHAHLINSLACFKR